MTDIVYKPNKKQPHRMSDDEFRRLEQMTDDEVEAAASDPDAQPLDDATLEKIEIARFVRAVRASTGLSQAKFANRYRFSKRTIEHWEAARKAPPSHVLAYYQLIRSDPTGAAQVLEEAGD